MTDPTQQVRDAFDRLLADERLPVTPLGEIVQRAEGPARRGWPGILATALATAFVLVVGVGLWQVGPRLLGNAGPGRPLTAMAEPERADVLTQCRVDGPGDRLVNAVEWPDGRRAAIVVNGTGIAHCLARPGGDLRISSGSRLDPGQDPLYCPPRTCAVAGGVTVLTLSDLPLGHASVMEGLAPEGATRVRVRTDRGYSVEAPVVNGTYIVRADSWTTSEVEFTEITVLGADGAVLMRVPVR
ncbi:hypothetical protein ABZ793_05535 [Micromonospora sp. NPDC047465]|uniref:hypothetical protein n=1 Tax=Micromonospora sp. NPDC047465 TaxID=3154813 RepID=UPI00340AB433